MRRWPMILFLVLVAVGFASAQGPGLFVRVDCTTITAPVTGQTWCFDATAQIVKVWNGTAFINPSAALVSSVTGYTKAALPAAGTAGRLARVTDDERGVWMAQGSQWFALGRAINVMEFGATGNGKVVADAAMTSGSATLTSATAAFVAGDVGKLCSVRGAGAASGDLVTSISAFISATQVTLVVAAGTTVTNETAVFGTSDATSINNAITAAIANKASVFFPDGNYVYNASLNATRAAGLLLFGTAQGANTSAVIGKGVRLLPVTTDIVGLDLTGSYQVTVRNIQIGSQPAAVRATVGILLAQRSGNAQANQIRLENTFVTGRYSVAPLYAYGVSNSYALGATFYNYENSQYAVVLTRDNINSVASPFQTIATGEQGITDWTFLADTEIQQNAATPGPPLRVRGVGRARFFGVNFSTGGVAASANVVFETVGSTINTGHAFVSNSFDGAGTNIFTATGNVEALALLGNSYSTPITDANIFGGAGTITQSAGASTPSLPFHTTVDVTIAAATTAYLGPAGHSTIAEASASGPVSGRYILDRLDVILTASPGGVQTVISTLMKNGIATAITCTITGAGASCNDVADSVVVVPADRLSLRSVTSATAAATQVQASVRANPF